MSSTELASEFRQATTPPCSPRPRRRVPSARTRPAIRLELVDKRQLSALPSPDRSPVLSSSPRHPPPSSSTLFPLSAPATSSGFPAFPAPCTPLRRSTHPTAYPTPSTPSPLRPRRPAGQGLGLGLPASSHSSFTTSSLASSSRPSSSSASSASRRAAHRRAPSLTFVPTPVRPSLAMSLTQSPPVPMPARRASHSRAPSLELEPPMRPPSRSERLLRETLARDTHQRSPRARFRRAESYSVSSPAPHHLPDMFDCCVDDDDDDAAEMSRHPPPLRRASRSVGSPSRSPDSAERTRAWIHVAEQQNRSQSQHASHPATPPSPVLSTTSLGLARRPSAHGRPRHHTHPAATGVLPPLPPTPRSALAHLTALQHQQHQQHQQQYQLGALPLQPAFSPRPRHTARPPSDHSSEDSSAASTPHTPPAPAPSLALAHPAFDAHVASAKLRETAGYVSFAAVEGLGCPGGDGEEDDGEDEARRGVSGWLKGLGIGAWTRA